MATQREKVKTLKLYVQSGVNSKGSIVYSTRTLGNVNTAVTDDDLLAIGTAAATLQSNTLEAVKITETYSLASA